jgi:uncharacterized protein (UPF0210 family)
MLKFCVENFHNLEKWMRYAFSITHVGELSGRSHVWEQEPEFWRVTFTTLSPTGEGRLFEHW